MNGWVSLVRKKGLYLRGCIKMNEKVDSPPLSGIEELKEWGKRERSWMEATE